MTGGKSTFAPPPQSPDAILASVEPFRRQIYTEVRGILDEMETVAPWALLYDPPNDAAEIATLVRGLVAFVEAIPGRLDGRLAGLRGTDDSAIRSSLEDAEFFYSGIHRMVEGDLERLRERAAAISALAGAAAVPALDRNVVAETAADLKGKYASALMGATASIVTEGRWDGVATEPILFPEKAEEFARNERLAEALRSVISALRQLGASGALPAVLKRWSEGRRVDRYALSELAILRGRIGVLLKVENRRALYSGDYHHIQGQEEQIAERLHALEDLHRRSWLLSALDDTYGHDLFGRLRRLAVEIAALLDVGLLETVYGEGVVRRLRTVASNLGAEGPKHPPEGVPEELAGIVPLLVHEDLATFLDMLLGAVLKRASFGGVRGAVAATGELDETLSFRFDEAEAKQEAAAPLLPSLDEVALAEPVAVPAKAAPAPPAAPEVPLEQRRQSLRELNEELRRLRSATNPHWRPVQMLQRLLAKHSRVPPTMVEAVHPYLYDLMNVLVPRLQAVADFGAVPTDAGEKLVRHCLTICEGRPDPREMDREVPRNLERIDRLLDAFGSAATSQLRSLGG